MAIKAYPKGRGDRLTVTTPEIRTTSADPSPDVYKRQTRYLSRFQGETLQIKFAEFESELRASLIGEEER